MYRLPCRNSDVFTTMAGSIVPFVENLHLHEGQKYKESVVVLADKLKSYTVLKKIILQRGHFGDVK